MQNSIPNEKDKRITNIILNHWNDIKGSRTLPAERDLDPTILEPLLDNCFLITVAGFADGKYDYKYLGENVMEAYGSDLTKRLNYDKGNPLTQRDKIQEVLAVKRPVSDEGEFQNINGDIVKYRQCIVPLSNDGINIDSVFGGMRLFITPRKF